MNIKHGKLLGDYVIVGPTKKKSKPQDIGFKLVELPLFVLVSYGKHDYSIIFL